MGMCPTDHAHRHLGDGVSDVVVEVEGLLLEFTRYGYRATSGVVESDGSSRTL